MQRKSKIRTHSQRQVKIDFTGKFLTSFRGTASLISRFICKVNFRDFIENHFPIAETSNNRTGIYSKIISFFITILNGGNRSGNISSGNGIIEFFDHTVSYLRKINITRILADSGYYLINFISHLEEKGFEYVISAIIIPILQKKIYGLNNWKKVTDGIEVSEFMFQHIFRDWSKDRKYIVIRQEIKKRPKASGKQLNIFSILGEEPSYRHQLLITNNTEDDPYTIWNYYKPRANDENIIENLKDGFDAFNLDNFWATEAGLMTICLIFHNLFLYLMKYIVNPEHSRQKLRTFRMRFLIVPGILGKDGRVDVLRLGIGNKTFRNKFKKTTRFN